MSNLLLANYFYLVLTLNGVICGSINLLSVGRNVSTQVPPTMTSLLNTSELPSTSQRTAFISEPTSDLPKLLLNATLSPLSILPQVGASKTGQSKRPDKPRRKNSGEMEGYIRNDGTYVINDSDGIPCILAWFSCKITVYYPVSKDKQKYDNVRVSPPRDVNVTGTCDRKSLVGTMNLTWNEGTFRLKFGFDDITDSWYVGQFSYVYDTSYKRYKGATEDTLIVLNSLPNRRFWATSHARSFRCMLLHDVTLVDDIDEHTGTIHFDEARVQALTRTANFKTPKHCIHRIHRNEMVPATVSGILAAMTVLTVAGYAVYRYFKVKKFQYDTME